MAYASSSSSTRLSQSYGTLEIGNPIAAELLEAIEASRIAIVVLSNNYATSKWCLEEIAKIAKCKEHSKLIVIIVFYHVDPSYVRRQGNCFQKGFSDHEANPEIAPHNVERWRDAFRKVGALSGLHVTQHK
ncbi:NB-ARC domains-containing protein [Tanacetum coccineum]